MAKGTKTINPADKSRREARRKELKKNKKQRQQVRSAAIERKDPEQVIAELEKLDKFEFDLDTNHLISDSVYKDKRKRLKETWTKILAYYLKEDPERHSKLKKLEADYEHNYRKVSREFEAIKAAQEVKLEDVFLPPEPNSALDEIADDDPLLSESVYITLSTEGIKPPGCPPGCPPDLKQLVDNLQTSLISQLALIPQPLPQDLISLRLSQKNTVTEPLSRAPSYSYRTRIRPQPGNQNNQRQQDINQNSRTQASIEAKQDNKLNQVGQKSTVIESKPVIFKTKASKFVPSSVRAKISKQVSK